VHGDFTPTNSPAHHLVLRCSAPRGCCSLLDTIPPLLTPSSDVRGLAGWRRPPIPNACCAFLMVRTRRGRTGWRVATCRRLPRPALPRNATYCRVPFLPRPASAGGLPLTSNAYAALLPNISWVVYRIPPFPFLCRPRYRVSTGSHHNARFRSGRCSVDCCILPRFLPSCSVL